MPPKTRVDLLIIGGGPAGSTVAALVKKYAPHLHVLVLEKARFPRHHVGESLLAGATPILEEMGVYERINRHGFIEKLGATYIWGQTREPWGFEFSQLITQLALQGKTLPDLYTKAWQVRREEYDQLLLRHAAEMGAEVREGVRVQRPLIDAATGRVTGVAYSDAHGAGTVGCHLLLDCTGQDAVLGHHLKLREYDERMNNYALYAYWQGAQWKYEYLGHPHLTRIFIATTPRGWIWYIPVRRDLISVGLVTHRAVLKEQKTNPERLYREELAACPEIAGLLEGAHCVRLSSQQPRPVMAVQDWSYTSRRMSGPGWALCGDAAGFVDPILSSGAMLAHELGQKAAYTINSMFRAGADEQIAAYWDFYSDTYRTYLQAYREMAAFWYSNNFSMASWWWQAQRTLDRQQDGVNLQDREAFARVAAGYANRAESLSLFGSYPLHEAVQLVDGLFGKVDTPAAPPIAPDDCPRLHTAVRFVAGRYFFQGLIRTTRRILAPDGKRYLDLHPGEEVLVERLNGHHTLAQVDDAARQIRTLQQRLPVRTGSELVVQLDAIGALA